MELKIPPVFSEKLDPLSVTVKMNRNLSQAIGAENASRIKLRHTLIVSHCDVNQSKNIVLLKDIIPNPFSVKQHGNKKMMNLFWRWANGNTKLLFDIAVLCENGTACICDCRHSECYGRVVVEVARRIMCTDDHSSPKVERLEANGYKQFQIFGKRDAVDKFIKDDIMADCPDEALAIIDSCITFKDWKFTCIKVLNMFNSVVDMEQFA